VVKALNPLGVSMYPTNPTTTIGGVSMMVTASTTSFLCNLDPGFSTSLRMWVIPALNPAKAVKWHFLDLSSVGKVLILPL